MAFAPPPSRIFSSSLRICATRSASARMLDSKRSEAGSTLVARTLLMARAVDSVRSGMTTDFCVLGNYLLYQRGLRFGEPSAGLQLTFGELFRRMVFAGSSPDDLCRMVSAR